MTPEKRPENKRPEEETFEEQALEKERYALLKQLEEWLELPVMILGFVWLILLFVELLFGLTSLLQIAVYTIWGIFILDFAIRLILAPRRLAYLRRNWLTVISLMLPAVRLFQVARVLRVFWLARATRGLRLVKLVGSLNRGLGALRASMGRRGFGYVLLFTVLVVLLGSAGMFTFEGPVNPKFATYNDALWWTALIMTTIGRGDWPQTTEGRVLGFLLALYAFTIFGYVTAFLASFFIGQEAEDVEPGPLETQNVTELREEIQSLRQEIVSLRQELQPNQRQDSV